MRLAELKQLAALKSNRRRGAERASPYGLVLRVPSIILLQLSSYSLLDTSVQERWIRIKRDEVQLAVRYEVEGQEMLFQPVQGEVFCVLPMFQRTGLPIHVSALFELDAERKHLVLSQHLEKAERNLELRRQIESAYIEMLQRLWKTAHDRIENTPSFLQAFYSLWPIPSRATSEFWGQLARNVLLAMSHSSYLSIRNRSNLREDSPSVCLQLLNNFDIAAFDAFELPYVVHLPQALARVRYRLHLLSLIGLGAP